MINIKTSVIQLPRYEVAQKARIKLNQNESPYDLPEEYKREITERMRRIPWNRYPVEDPQNLKKALSEYTNHPADGIVIGNGSNELILASLMATCNKGDCITMIRPGFAIYPYLAGIMELKIKEVPLKDDFSFDVKGLLQSAKHSKVIIFATPNNPTGTAIDICDIARILHIEEPMIIVDEAYYEFHGVTCQKLLERHRNLIILRTFSKAFGLAGIRLGYLLCHPDVAREISKAKLPFSVGVLQMVIAEFLLKRRDFVMESVKKIINEREKVYRNLSSIPDVLPIPSRANFILFKTNSISSTIVFEQLYKKGILIRSFNNPALMNMLRVTIGAPEENEIFINELAGIIKDSGGKNA